MVRFAAAALKHVLAAFHFRYDDATVNRAVHDIDDFIHNFFDYHPPAVNHLLDDCPAERDSVL
jgi:hypothetical protein